MQISSLFLSDHLWVIENFHKQSGSQVFHPIVIDILRRYLSSESIKIHFNEHGKPRVLCDTGSLYFSLSHSGDVLALFLSRDFDVGVDVEMMKERRYQQKINDRYFDKKTIDTLGFYRAWTAREAFVKAVGCGIDKNFAGICTVDQNEGSLIGFGKELSHQINFVSFKDRYLIATCRTQNVESKEIKFHLSC